MGAFQLFPLRRGLGLAGLLLLLTGAGLAVRAARRHGDGGPPA
jgi:uncharacterized membrane protein